MLNLKPWVTRPILLKDQHEEDQDGVKLENPQFRISFPFMALLYMEVHSQMLSLSASYKTTTGSLAAMFSVQLKPSTFLFTRALASLNFRPPSYRSQPGYHRRSLKPMRFPFSLVSISLVDQRTSVIVADKHKSSTSARPEEVTWGGSLIQQTGFWFHFGF